MVSLKIRLELNSVYSALNIPQYPDSSTNEQFKLLALEKLGFIDNAFAEYNSYIELNDKINNRIISLCPYSITFKKSKNTFILSPSHIPGQVHLQTIKFIDEYYEAIDFDVKQDNLQVIEQKLQQLQQKEINWVKLQSEYVGNSNFNISYDSRFEWDDDRCSWLYQGKPCKIATFSFGVSQLATLAKPYESDYLDFGKP